MKPREWWLREWTDSQPDKFLSDRVRHTIEYDVYMHSEPDTIHVIEKSAYDKAVAALKEISDLSGMEVRYEKQPSNIAKKGLRELGEI